MVIFGKIICISYNSIYKSNYCTRCFIYYSEINYLFWKSDVAVQPFEFNKEWIPGYIIKKV